jgi:hypothetical protein
MQRQLCFLKLICFSPGWRLGFTILNWRKTEEKKTRNGLTDRAKNWPPSFNWKIVEYGEKLQTKKTPWSSVLVA